ncbi:shikimate kinase [Halarcobacter ebronensis]|uniref:Shikimate kinase n=2 Tax=Halarcobacter ebronensis TaxID=1462615 RepID=A0A4Q1ASJ6_9BACT|nr:shikimate kinase [Halarcobacter ebronensis]RXK06448.1 shikimate kinase [Halarcobacter ebronensis]
MGVGKGTIARALVKASNYFAIDTDDLIESVENKKIKKIFSEEGEPYFRNLEKKCALWLEKNVDNTIISTGGGFFRQENIHNIGKIIYLESSFDGILKRINNSENAQAKLKKRPLLTNLEEAKNIYSQRVKDYEKVADIIVNVENRTIEEITKEILGKM